MIILHKQNASVVTFLSFVFSCPSFPFLPPTHPCRKGFVPRSDPTPNPPSALPTLQSRRDWEGGFDPTLESWFLTQLLWDPAGRGPVSALGWRAPSGIPWKLSSAKLCSGRLCPVEELSGMMGQAGSLLPGCVLVLGMGSRTPHRAVPGGIGAAIPGTAHPCSAREC